MRGLDMRATISGPTVGAAAAIKMVRSVMIKGIEALCQECFLAAHRAGVEEQTVATLSDTYPGVDWPKVVAYNLERMANHGERSTLPSLKAVGDGEPWRGELRVSQAGYGRDARANDAAVRAVVESDD